MGTYAMPAPYAPPEEETDKKLVRISIRMEESESKELHYVARIWDQLDSALGSKRRYRWSAASVIERLIRVGVDDFWTQIGGAPREGESGDDLLSRAQAAIRKQRKK